MSEERGVPRKKPKGRPVEFNRDALKEWVTGFRKRKQVRREYGAIQAAKKQRLERNQARKERREALKIKDRLTGAFGEKYDDDSDDELGHAAQDQEEEMEEKKKQKTDPQEAVMEDEEAVVTVVTREASSSDEDSLDDAAEEAELAAATAAAKRIAGESFTPYQPSKTHQAAALQKAKAIQAMRKKDAQFKKGIKGGHKFKRANITSKKKKIKQGSKKGANRER